MSGKVLNVVAVAVVATLLGGSAAQAAPAPFEGDSLTSATQGVNSLKSDVAKLVVEIDGMAKRYAKESVRMAGRSKAADDKYAKAAVKFTKLSEAAVKLKSEARVIKSGSALSKVRKKKGVIHKLASTAYLEILEKTPVTK
jgi:hypothetical protein